MNKKNFSEVIKEALKEVNPPEKDFRFIKKSLRDFLKKFKQGIKKQKIKADIFVGGSFAKGTMIKKKEYDADVFIRFSRDYPNSEISNLLQKIIKFSGIKAKKIHGSRDYFKIQAKNLSIELIPVLKISSPKEAENVTDLSYSHVKYVKRKIKSEKIKNEIKIAKAFCHASGVYGAESYIKGFSGYSLELLVHYYKGFLKFIKAASKMNPKKQKTIIDIEKHYANRSRVLIDMNASKLNSPIILVDPTCKQRNVLAALSEDTFKKFQKTCRNFLKKPGIEFFKKKDFDSEKIRNYAKKHALEFLALKADTNKQKGDIAGSKLLKFFKHLAKEISRYFDIKKEEFNYNEKKSAEYYFAVKAKKCVISKGPFEKDKKNSKAFKETHKNSRIFIKNKRLYAEHKINFTCREFLEEWKKKNKKRMREMSIIILKIMDSAE